MVNPLKHFIKGDKYSKNNDVGNVDQCDLCGTEGTTYTKQVNVKNHPEGKTVENIHLCKHCWNRK